MPSAQMPNITDELLRSYSAAALRNANELHIEASLLLEHCYDARAYFLAVACIEEVGKALLAFDAQNRNLSDQGVRTKLKLSTESHSVKISYALGVWAINSPDSRAALEVAVDLIIHLEHGREPSMYTDLRSDPDRVLVPKMVVRRKAAEDCVRIAGNALVYANRHVDEKTPIVVTEAQDRLFAMKSSKFQRLISNIDFWWYYISRFEAGYQDIAEAVIGYERDHIKAGTLFRPAHSGA